MPGADGRPQESADPALKKAFRVLVDSDLAQFLMLICCPAMSRDCTPSSVRPEGLVARCCPAGSLCVCSDALYLQNVFRAPDDWQKSHLASIIQRPRLPIRIYQTKGAFLCACTASLSANLQPFQGRCRADWRGLSCLRCERVWRKTLDGPVFIIIPGVFKRRFL